MLARDIHAPAFTLKDQENREVSLSDFLGTFVILYFYPKDDTPGCTREACSLRDSYDKLEKHAVILGVSSDNVASHKKFAEKFHLPFRLLADTKKDVIRAYQADGIYTKRITYLIDPEGVIVKAYDHVTPATHAQELSEDLNSMLSEERYK